MLAPPLQRTEEKRRRADPLVGWLPRLIHQRRGRSGLLGGGRGVENGKGKEKRETTTKLRSEKKYIVFSQWAYPGTNFKYEATYRSNWPPSLMPIYDNPTKRIVSPTRRYPVAMPPPE
jgi:hypothetical protein